MRYQADRVRGVLSLLLLAGWLTSLFLPAGIHIHPDESTRIAYGGDLLMTGWAGIPVGQVGWLGNPLLFLALALGASSKRRSYLRLFTAVSLAYSFGNSLVSRMNIDMDPDALYLEGNGYWLWMSCILVATIWMFVSFERRLRPLPS